MVLMVKNLPGNAGDRLGLDLGVGKIPWRREWQPTPVFLPGESHGKRRDAFHRVAKNQTWLKQLSRHACMHIVKKSEESKTFKEFSLLQASYQLPQDSDLGWLLARRKLWKIVKDRPGPWGHTESDNWTTATGGEVVVLTRQSICFKLQ